MKYPIEIEITNKCLLKCNFCPNKSFINKWFMDFKLFKKLIDYILINKDNVLFLDFCWIWDIFLHPDFDLLFSYMESKLTNTWIKVLIPTKWNSITKNQLNLLHKSYLNWLNINISIWFYSMNKKIHDKLSWFPNFNKIIFFIKNLKKHNIPFSLELLINKYSIREIDFFYNFWKILWADYKVHNYHNFWWTIKSNFWWKLNSDNFKFDCSFDYTKTNLYNSFCVWPMPLISYDGFLYFCTHWWKQNSFKWLDINFLINKYKNISDLFKYSLNSISFDTCNKCTYFKK